MATKRMISQESWSDSFVGRLSFIHRLLWIGLITIADDQGRIEDDALMIAARLFPYNRDVPEEEIETGLQIFYEAGRVTRYKANGKSLIQLSHWWKHQSPPFAMPSKYPGPDGWTDRERYHAAGGKIIKRNWEEPGGYVEATKVQGRGKVAYREEKSREEKSREEKSREEKSREEKSRVEENLFTLYEKEIGVITPVVSDILKSAAEEYPETHIRKAIQEAALRNARNWKYIEAILKDWRANGIGGKKPAGNNKKHPLDALIEGGEG